MANFYSTPVDGCYNCPMQHNGDCKQPYADRPLPAAVRAAVDDKLPPPPGCILYDLPLYLHGRFADAHPSGTTPRDRDAEDALITLLAGPQGAELRALGIQLRVEPAQAIKQLGDALVTCLAAQAPTLAQQRKPVPASLRCPTCDREACPRWTWALQLPAVVAAPELAAFWAAMTGHGSIVEYDECRRHAVDWRMRACLAEADAFTLAKVTTAMAAAYGDDLPAIAAALRADAEKWRAIKPLFERMRTEMGAERYNTNEHNEDSKTGDPLP